MERQKRIEFDAPTQRVVAKANDLVRARHSFSTVEQRIFAMMVARLDRESEFPVQEISLRKVCDLSGTDKSNIYRKADQISDNLIEQSVEVRSKTEDGEREFTKYSCFSLCRHREGSGTIEAKFNEDMRPFLLQLKEKFTLYLITVYLRLRSKYSTQIYELLKMRQGIFRLRMSVEDFRHSLGLEDKYSRFWQLKRRVIEQAREELKEKADIFFTYNIIREGNSPKEIEFFIHENESVLEELHQNDSSVDEETLDGASAGRSEREQVVEQGPEKSQGSKPPNLDVRKMFLQDLTQEEIESLSKSRIDDIYKRARAQAEASNSDTTSTSVIAYETHTRMRKIWQSEED